MSIKLDVDPWCRDCPDFEADVKKKKESYYCYYESDHKTISQYLADTVITCVNRDRCYAIKHYFEKVKEND